MWALVAPSLSGSARGAGARVAGRWLSAAIGSTGHWTTTGAGSRDLNTTTASSAAAAAAAAATSLPATTHATTILSVRKGGEVVLIGDGQATQDSFVVKADVVKVRRLGGGGGTGGSSSSTGGGGGGSGGNAAPAAIGGFAGRAADGLTLFDRLEQKLEAHPGQLARAAVELAKDWRRDRVLRHLDALLLVADAQTTLWVSGNGDVIEAPGGVMAIGSGADYAEAAARALLELEEETGGAEEGGASASSSSSGGGGGDGAGGGGDTNRTVAGGSTAMDIALRAMRIAADCCVYTNHTFAWHRIAADGKLSHGRATATEVIPAPAEDAN